MRTLCCCIFSFFLCLFQLTCPSTTGIFSRSHLSVSCRPALTKRVLVLSPDSPPFENIAYTEKRPRRFSRHSASVLLISSGRIKWPFLRLNLTVSLLSPQKRNVNYNISCPKMQYTRKEKQKPHAIYYSATAIRRRNTTSFHISFTPKFAPSS